MVMSVSWISGIVLLLKKREYFDIFYRTVTHKSLEHDENSGFTIEQVSVLFCFIHKYMRQDLQSVRRREITYALKYWKSYYKGFHIISLIPFNKVATAAFSSQTSSASSDRLFSDFGIPKDNQRKQLLISCLEMTQAIRRFVTFDLKQTLSPQKGLIHPKKAAFKSIVNVFVETMLEKQKNRGLTS